MSATCNIVASLLLSLNFSQIPLLKLMQFLLIAVCITSKGVVSVTKPASGTSVQCNLQRDTADLTIFMPGT